MLLLIYTKTVIFLPYKKYIYIYTKNFTYKYIYIYIFFTMVEIFINNN